MSGRPGAGCDDPREVHPHWCGFCGVLLFFGRVQCVHLIIVPPCPRCDGTDWRTEVDEMTSPDYREK